MKGLAGVSNCFGCRDIKYVIENNNKQFFGARDFHDASDINLRFDKQSFFIGEEFKVPLTENLIAL